MPGDIENGGGGSGVVRSDKRTVLNVCLLGIGRLISFRTKYWNYGLHAGSHEFFVSLALVSVGYICLTGCLAELCSTLPFTGGTYGFVRGILNPYWGYIAGNFEVYVNLVALSSIIIAFGDSCSQVMGLPVSMQPVTWPILLIASGIIHAYGNQIFWTFSDVLTVISLIILVLFVVLSVQHLDLNQYEQPEKAQPDIQHTIGFTSLTSLFYCAIELLPVVAHEAAEPSKAIVRGLGVTMTFSLISAFLVVLLTCWQSPGPSALAHASLPLSFAFANGLNIPVHTAAIFNIPLQFTSFVCTMYCVSIIVKSMAKSHFLPAHLAQTTENNVPKNALVMCYGNAIIFSLQGFYIQLYLPSLFYAGANFAGMIMYLQYIAIFVAYLRFKPMFPTLNRNFTMPFGEFFAVLGILFFVGLALSTGFYPVYGWYFFLGVILMVSILTAGYYLYVKESQCFSDEENRIMFKAFVVNANRSRSKSKKQSFLARWLPGYSSLFGGGSGGSSPMSPKSPSARSVSHYRKKLPAAPTLTMPPAPSLYIASNGKFLKIKASPHSIASIGQVVPMMDESTSNELDEPAALFLASKDTVVDDERILTTDTNLTIECLEGEDDDDLSDDEEDSAENGQHHQEQKVEGKEEEELQNHV